MIKRGESLCLVWATKEKDGEALGGSTRLKEENRFVLCVGTKRMVNVMHWVGSRD